MVKLYASIFFRWIYSNDASNERGYSNFSEKSKNQGYFNKIRSFNDKAKSLGFRVADPFITKGLHFCEVDFRDHYIIYPSGNVFLCTHNDDKNNSLFNLSESMLPDLIHSKFLPKYTRWMTTGPFEDQKCVTCKLLPACLGGCRKERYEGRKNCLMSKDTIPFFIENAIAQRINCSRY